MVVCIGTEVYDSFIAPSKNWAVNMVLIDRWRFGVSTPTQYALGFSRFCVNRTTSPAFFSHLKTALFDRAGVGSASE